MTLFLANRKFGKLTVTETVKRVRRCGRSRRFWKCVCACGRIIWVEASNLTTGNSKACAWCGKTKHGHTSRGKQTGTYKTWASMLSRCHNKKYDGYYLYGGRGIKVCRRWRAFKNFLVDMGERPDGKSIERINCNGNYFPDNCYWATLKQQAENRRTTRLSHKKAKQIRKLFSKGMIKADIARKFNVSFPAICRVLDNSRWA